MEALLRLKTFIWLVEQQRGNNALNRHMPLFIDRPISEESKTLLEHLKDPLSQVIAVLKPEKQELAMSALNQGSIDGLIKCRLLTGKLQVSGSLIRGKKRDSLAPEIAIIDQALKTFINYQRTQLLDQIGGQLMALYQRFQKIWDGFKISNAMVEFDDIAKGSFVIQHAPEAGGARFLIHKSIRHLMLDEFQDTSLLQWAIFEPICQEMLAGQGLSSDDEPGVTPSIFIVGDEKQSIYGFREADPEIMRQTRQTLRDEFGIQEVPLNKSFRTTSLILEYVNQVFKPCMENFPEHQTAVLGGKLVVPDLGSITIAEAFEGDDQETGIAKEAQFVAQYLKDALYGPNSLQVFDKTTSRYRPLEPRDCVVLYRATTHALVFEDALRKEGLSTIREDGAGFFQRPEINDIMSLFRYISIPDDHLSLATVLKSPMIRVRDEDLTNTLEAMKASPFNIPDFLLDKHPSLKEISRWQRQHAEAPSRLLLDIFQTWACFSCYDQAFGEEEGRLAKSNLVKLLEKILEWQKNGHTTILSIVKHLESLKKVIDLPLAQVSRQAITLMTIHKSKGLEYPLVALIGTGEPWAKRDRYWAKSESKAEGAGVFYMGRQSLAPEGHEPYHQVFEANDQEAQAENLRLLYVALTRARHHLLISGNVKPHQNDLVLFQRLWDAGDMMELPKRTRMDHPILQISQGQTTIASEPTPDPQHEAPPPVRPRPLEHIASEVTTLAPSKLLSEDDGHGINAIDELRGFRAVMGTFIHQGLEYHLKGEEFPPRESFIDLLDPNLKLDPRLDLAYTTARNQLQQVLGSESFLGLMADYPIRHPELPILYMRGHDLIRGTLDLYLEQPDNHGMVLDFKTTDEIDHRDDAALLAFAKKKNYVTQLEVYAEGIRRIKNPTSLTCAVYFTKLNRMVRWDYTPGKRP